MSAPAVKFNVKDRPEFFKELRKRVNQHFKDNNITKHANNRMRFKTLFMVCLYFIPFIVLVSGSITSFWPMMAMWFLMGLGMSGIGLSVMHDANHGAYSSKPAVNKAMGFLLNFVGGYPPNWIIQHNVLHHSYTNVHDHDEDIDKKVMRFSPTQAQKPIFKYQAYYATFFYSLMTIYWLIAKDFEQLFRYRKKGLLAGQGLTFGKALFQIIFHKIWYIALFIVLPFSVLTLPAWQILIGFLMMHFMSGIILAFIFQPAHVLEETEFFLVDEEGSVENNWAIHQLKTTANFGNGNTFFSWYVGGLNYQVEHHLFPHICHVHYRHISKIVKATAEEYGVPYHQHKTFFDALKSHFSLLNQLGTGSYDRALEMKQKAAA